MARRSRIRRAGKAKKSRLNKVEGLDHPEFAFSHFKRAGTFANYGEAQLAAQEKLLRRL